MRLVTLAYMLSLLGTALAECGVEGGTIVVANPNYQILDDLDTCSTIFGDILIDPAFVYFILQGPQEITGTIIAHDNTILKSLGLIDVKKLGGLSFASPTISTHISFPEVTEIGNLEWRNITWQYEGDYFSWEAGKLVGVSNLDVEATYLSGFSPDYPTYDGSSFYYGGLVQLETADNIRVVGNQRMNEVLFQSLKTISGTLLVGSNINFLNSRGKRDGNSPIVSMPALESVGNVVIYDDDDIFRASPEGKIDFPVLGHVYGDLNITNIGGVSGISVPTLTDVDGGLYILGNKGLKTLDFRELRRVNRIVIDGGDSYYGGFETISFPVLEEVGAFHVIAPAYNFDCSSLDRIRGIASEFSCSNSHGTYDPDVPSSASEVPTPSPSDTASSSTGEPSLPNEPSLTSVPSVSSGPVTTDEPSLTSDPATNDEPNAMSEPVDTDQPSRIDSTAPTGSVEPTRTLNGDMDASPTNESPPETSGSAPASSDASNLKAPFRVVSWLIKCWLM
ncbi:hypothetical protein GGS24DRAFT_506049 [Hypoxylon argillaceum]|nr:hypothetical protein GGS24DRAFT_506049 [Hypoxylon argillaceum]